MTNEITGYDTIPGGQKLPRFSGPCKRCGATDYGLSTSGPDYCGACAIGIPVEEIHLRREAQSMSKELVACRLALQLATGIRYYMTDKMRDIGQAFLDEYLAEATQKGFGPVS